MSMNETAKSRQSRMKTNHVINQTRTNKDMKKKGERVSVIMVSRTGFGFVSESSGSDKFGSVCPILPRGHVGPGSPKKGIDFLVVVQAPASRGNVRAESWTIGPTLSTILGPARDGLLPGSL